MKPVFRDSEIQKALEMTARLHLHARITGLKEDEIELPEEDLEVTGELLGWAALSGTLTVGIFGHDSVDSPLSQTGEERVRQRERFTIALVRGPDNSPPDPPISHTAPAEVSIDSENLPLLSMGGVPILRWIDVESSFIEALRFDPWAQELEVRIRRGPHEPSAFYTHSRVGFEEFSELMESPSKGSYYNTYIRQRKLASSREDANVYISPKKALVKTLLDGTE